MRKITVTCDKNANLKKLRTLERNEEIEIHAVSIEGIEDTKKITNQQLPIAVFDSKFATIGNCVIAADDTPYSEIQRIIGKHNHGDCLHLERHISSGRDVFVTDDNDFLSKRGDLQQRFGVTIKTVEELEAELVINIK